MTNPQPTNPPPAEPSAPPEARHILLEDRRTIAMSETDAAGLVHFAALCTWAEDLEAAWFRQKGWDWFSRGPESILGYPRRTLEAAFFRPLFFPASIRTVLLLDHVGQRSIALRAEFFTEGSDDLAVRLQWRIVHAELFPLDKAAKALLLPEHIRQELLPQSAPLR